MAKSAKARSVGRATGWLVALRWMVRGLGIGRTLILAGILLPVDFGRAILAISIVLFVEAVTELQVDYSLIRSQDNPDSLYDAAWTLQIIRGFVSGLVIALSAPWIGYFYEDPLLVQPLYLLAIAVVVGGFVNVGMAEFHREMDFRKVFVAAASSRVASLVVAVAVAIVTKSFWAILIGYMVQRLVDVLVSYLMQRRRPKVGLVSASEIIRHSKWIMLEGILFQVLLRADVFLIGKFAGPAALGPYYLAKMIAELIGAELSTGLRGALFSKLARTNRETSDENRPDQSSETLQNAALLSLLIGAPFSVLLALCARDLVSFALEPQWASAIVFLHVFSLGALFSLADAAPAAVILAAGLTRMIALRQAVSLLVFVPALWIAMQSFGLQGAAIAVVITALVGTLFSFAIAMRHVQGRWRVLGTGMLRILVALLALTAVVLPTLALLPEVTGRWNLLHVLRIATASVVGLAMYGLAVRWQWQLIGRPGTYEETAGKILTSLLSKGANRRSGS